MATLLVGVDMGADSIRAVEVTGVGSKRPTVTRFHEIPLPDGAVKNGEVVEVNTVAAALRQLWSQARFKSREVVLGIGNAKVLVRDVTVPKLNRSELRQSLPAHVQDMLPVPVAEALLDFYPVSEGMSETGPVVNGLLVAAIKDAVLTNVEAVQKAGLHPVGVDLIPFAITRLTVNTPRTGFVAHVDVGAKTTNVVVTRDGVPQFVRIMTGGGHDVTAALATRLEIPESQADQLKRQLGLGNPGTITAEQIDAVNVVREVTGGLLNSLRNTLAYFSNTRGNEPYSAIVITGGGAKLPGFVEALSEISRIPVIATDVLSAVEVSKDAAKRSADDAQSMQVALGLALGGAAA